MLLNRPHPGPGIQAESFSGFRTESAIVSPSSGNFPVRNTYNSALSYSTATFFPFLSPSSPEISNQLVDSNTLVWVDAIFIRIEQQRGIWEQVSVEDRKTSTDRFHCHATKK